MTYSPIYGTDPLDGLSFSFGQRLRSAHMNPILVWLRSLDKVLERSISTNWPFTASGHAGNDARAAVYDPTNYYAYVSVGDDGGGAPDCSLSYDGNTWFPPPFGPPPAGTMTVLNCAATDGAGLIVAGGSAGATNDKYRRSTNGGTSWAQQQSSVATAHHIQTICYAPSIALFIAASVASGGTGIIETSPTGLTGSWTSRAVPGACAAYSWAASASDPDGFTVLVPSDAGATNFASSPDGITWTARVVPAGTNWKAVAYARYSEQWLAVRDNAAPIQSSDGITWAVGTATLPPNMGIVYGLTSTGNLFVYHGSDGISQYIWISDDWGATWHCVAELGTAGSPNSLYYAAGTSNGGRVLCSCTTQTYASLRMEI